jgi:hypothetical protein
VNAKETKAEYVAKVMRHQTSTIHLIYLKPDRMLLSQKQYSDWYEIQDEYESYLTSVGPFSIDELMEFLSEEYGSDTAKWGFSREDIEGFMKSGATVLEARRDG